MVRRLRQPIQRRPGFKLRGGLWLPQGVLRGSEVTSTFLGNARGPSGMPLWPLLALVNSVSLELPPLPTPSNTSLNLIWGIREAGISLHLCYRAQYLAFKLINLAGRLVNEWTESGLTGGWAGGQVNKIIDCHQACPGMCTLQRTEIPAFSRHQWDSIDSTAWDFFKTHF